MYQEFTMRFEDLFKSEDDTHQSLTRNSDDSTSRGRDQRQGSFGIGPVNLQRGPLSAFRKRPGQNNLETGSTDPERRYAPEF